MELNREQIVTALECCASRKQACRNCPVPQDVKDDCRCMEFISRNVLALIRELTDENESHEAEKEHLDLVVEGKLKRIQSLDRMVLKLIEENERLKAQVEQAALTEKDLRFRNHEFCRANVSLSKYADELQFELSECVQIKADTLKDVQIRFAMHFGTYTEDAEVKVSEVFKLLSKFAEEMLEGEI